MFDLNSNADLLRESRSVTIQNSGIVATRVYRLENTNDPEEVPSLLNSAGIDIGDKHPELVGLYLREISVEPDVHNVKVTLEYGPDKLDAREDENGEIWEWSLATQQTHITSVDSPAKQLHFPAWANVGTAIGVHEDQVDGADVYRPTGTLRITKRFDSTQITSHFRRQLIDASATVNASNWKDWEAGEVLFLGADLAPSGPTEHRVIYNFQFARKRLPYTVFLHDGSTVTIEPGPWDHVWFKHAERMVNADSGERVKQTGVESVHVAQVYGPYEFRYLRIDSVA